MKKLKFTEAQIVFALKQAKTAPRSMRSTARWASAKPTFYAWHKKFGGLGVAKLRRLRQLEEENRKLKQLVG
ncbi:transposase [Xanthomonas campestris pv. pennamericanum]|nr:transposase [Xanthomonas euvesicatoria]MBV6809464.1 transposase [Xanthomonas campestris pv. pennamericanum]